MAKELKLYDHQQPSVDALRRGFGNGHRAQILMAPTGFGKSVVAALLLKLAAAKGRRGTFVVDRVSLVNQTSAVLTAYGIGHGIVRAGVRRDTDAMVQVCSAQTIEAQGYFPETDLLIVDECHDTRECITEFIKAGVRVKRLQVIGLTATPFTKGLGDIYSHLVNVCTTSELLAMGELAPVVPYAAKQIDMSDQVRGSGEWSDKVVAGRALKIVGDVVAEWREKTVQHFGGPVKTIVFAASIAHGAELCRQFQMSGFNFVQISAKDKDEQRREQLIEEFRKPDSAITGLVACEVFTKGFDVPDILCGISARPYRKSLSKHIQQLGRVMRKHPGKEYALWLDHSGNYVRFLADMQDVFENGLSTLTEGLKKDSKVRHEPTTKDHEAWTCSCGYIFQQPLPKCPACGKEKVRTSAVVTLPGVMEAVDQATSQGKSKEKDMSWMNDRASVWRQICSLAVEKRKNAPEKAPGFAFAQYRELYRGARPPLDFDPSVPCGADVRGEVMRRFVAAMHRRRAA